MKRQFTINEKAQVVYIQDDLAESGWKGAIDGYLEPFTIILAKPGATTEEVLGSIRRSIEEIKILRSNGAK